MLIGEIPNPAATRAKLNELVTNGKVLHGSPVRGLKLLRPSTTRFHHMNGRTTEVLSTEKLVCGTDDISYAIFFAAAHAPARDERIAHNIPRRILGSGIIFNRDQNGQYIDTDYYAAKATKEFIRGREAKGIYGEVYYYPKEGLRYQELDRAWVTSENIEPEGSLLVAVACLPFDYYQLAEPDSNPIIREITDRADDELSKSLHSKR